jgi:hypothetical protein
VQTVKNELANAADAAAMAGVQRLMPLTPPPGYTEPPWPMLPFDATIETAVIQAANEFSNRNTVNPSETDLKEGVVLTEVITGHWDFQPVPATETLPAQAGTFTPNPPGVYNSNTNAVRVEANAQGSVTMTLAGKLFGITVTPFARAVAVVGYLDTLPAESRGGFIGANETFMHNLFYHEPPFPEGTKFYIIIGPAGGQLSWEFADNGGWVAPVGTNPTPPYLQDVIANGTTFDMTAGETVANLSNGEESPVIMDIQEHVPMNIVIPSFNTNVWNQNETVQNFWDITITAAWKPGDKLPEYALENLRPLTDGDKLGKTKAVGVIEFELHGLYEFQGGGGGTPSNIYSSPRLVWNEAFANFRY